MGKALYRKYRSKRLDEVVGQEHITGILKSALDKGKISHAYLFTGPRGVGKTSVARILAHEINGFDYTDEDSLLDIIEIDAASNNGVDDIRNLREKVQIAPVQGKYKIYIIDEVHMLSKAAFNALLKTLEEPPEHVVFIMATTDAHKLPATIISRSQQFVFRLISNQDVMKHLKFIAKEEDIKISAEALELIAKKGGGSLRDCISLLDQISGINREGEIDKETVERALGLASEDMVKDLVAAHLGGSLNGVLTGLKMAEEIGVKPEILAGQLIKYILEQIEEKPELLSVLNKLTEIGRGAYPDIKLLAALANGCSEKPEAKKEVKSMPLLVAKPEEKVAVEKPVKLETSEPAVKKEALKVFKWDDILDGIKQKHMAFYTVLSKCDFEINGGKMIIYAKTAFYKKRLDLPKFRELFNAELAKTNTGELEIEVTAKVKPNSDAKLKQIADIMGGGEEVDV